ncbi:MULTISPECIES: PadR family transcriptional regulator [Microbacterium]|uniref:PadR family transcriptional regulator n=1 Tax=Microbacterium maritypicum TaxID=33918 RepID=A0A4Y4B8P9_MICMQ|nr:MULTISPECIES: PadR family transcriptional regulator [Microbacterium]QYG12090.1 PadR family transcriptional regulator [Microbacterium sp. PAMC22086]GEC75404.1 PadR family transcriptional regulator [Microbacterium liquefaciens]GGV58154.1 PadR family transcriptional regulator [Microbacterium liquefaciens]
MAKDAVDRLTPMGVMVLALLREGDMHPYEMLRLMRARHDDRLLTITNGTLYHTVSRLHRAGLIDELGIGREGNRPERTIYALTDAGREAVMTWVQRELPRIDRPADFRIALAEAHNLERPEVIDLLRARRLALVEDHARHRDGLHAAREKSVPEQVLVEIERQEALLAAELGWLDSLLDRLETQVLPWGPSAFQNSDRYRAQRKAAQQ